jgi:hypothetical protein
LLTIEDWIRALEGKKRLIKFWSFKRESVQVTPTVSLICTFVEGRTDKHILPFEIKQNNLLGAILLRLQLEKLKMTLTITTIDPARSISS